MKYIVLSCLLILGSPVLAERAIVGTREETAAAVGLIIDLPTDQHVTNKAGSDGSGLCVFASMDQAARWHRIVPLIGILDRMTHYPGGGWPEKVDQVIAREYPGYKSYAQAEGESGIQLMEWAIANRHIVCVTYGFGERYGRGINHMVNLVHLDANNAVIEDNNFPGTYERMSRAEFIRRWKMRGGAWAYAFWEAPPPPIPTN